MIFLLIKIQVVSKATLQQVVADDIEVVRRQKKNVGAST